MATAQEALTWVDKLYTRLAGRREEIRKQFEYLEGEHPLAYASEAWAKHHKARFKGFSDNWCGVVARSPVRRLKIEGVRIGDDSDTLSTDEKELNDDWERNELTAFSKQGFLASVTAKRSATIVWAKSPSDNEPVVTWEHPSQVIVAYDATGRRKLAALKAWDDDELGVECATLYLPDEVWKFQRPRGVQVTVTNGVTQAASGLLIPSSSTIAMGAWQPRMPAGEAWPLKNPLGEVPVSEWVNRPLLGGEPLSDISGTMAMQDAINLLWAYMFNAADYASMPARIVLGAEPPNVPILNNQGQVIGTRPATQEDLINGRILFVPRLEGDTSPNPTSASWDAANLDVFTKVVQEAVAHVAAQTSTPGHYLLSNEKFANLNGDALTAAEVPLVDRVTEMQESFTAAARSTYRLMALVRGKKDVADELRIGRIQWKDAAMHSLAQVADAATKDKSVGISLATILRRRYGMSPPEVQAELDRIKAEQFDPVLSTLMKDASDAQAAAEKGVGGDQSGVNGSGTGL